MVYLDYNASTPIDQRVLPSVVEAMSVFGNPASTHHSIGQAAAELVERGRHRVASLCGRPDRDVILTSGATEAASLGLIGAMLNDASRPNAVVAATEHRAIIAAVEVGARLSGGELRTVRVNESGMVDLNQLQDLLDDSVSVVSVMAANNETGVIGPISAVRDLAHELGVLNFVDITQLLGKGSVTEAVEAADLAVCSSHKIYGPKGVGALIASRAVQRRISPLMEGGGQERGLRGGTQNTAAIVGFGAAAELVERHGADDNARIADLTRHLLRSLHSGLENFEINGEGAEVLPNTLNVRFVGADAEAVMASMPHVCVSAGSACHAASPAPSHVLLAMGRKPREADESLRISLGRPTTSDEVDIAAAAIIRAVSRVRKLSAA